MNLMNARRSLCRPAAVVIAGAVFVGCGAQAAARGGALDGQQGDALETLSHEKCDEGVGKLEALDSNGDGKPDVFTVTESGSGRNLCRYADLNRDGRPDLYEYFDPSGGVRRREFVYGSASDVDAVEIYSGGRLVRRLFDTMGRHRADTWDWFDRDVPLDPATGRPAHPSRRERDTRNLGRIDQWWTWSGDSVTIVTDRNGDGQPDPGSAVVLGGNNRSDLPPLTASGDAGAASDGGDLKTSLDAGTATMNAAESVDGATLPLEASVP